MTRRYVDQVEKDELQKALGKYSGGFVSIGVLVSDLIDMHRYPNPNGPLHDNCVYGKFGVEKEMNAVLEELENEGKVEIVKIHFHRISKQQRRGFHTGYKLKQGKKPK